MSLPYRVAPVRPAVLHGYSPIYHVGRVNECPGCGRSQWLIGRATAECAFCSTAVPLDHTGLEGIALGSLYWERDIYRHGWHCGPQRQDTADWEWD